MLIRNRMVSRIVLAVAIGCFAAVGSADAASRREHTRRHLQQADQPDAYGQSATRGQAQYGYGDTSGYPGGNEFDPTAPFGGQAAVTAQPGTDAYKIEMQQRRRYCIDFSNRC